MAGLMSAHIQALKDNEDSYRKKPPEGDFPFLSWLE